MWLWNFIVNVSGWMKIPTSQSLQDINIDFPSVSGSAS
jgi:hypothetical protein